MRTKRVTANEVRIPDLNDGEVVLIERYGKPYAAVITASELDLFQRLLAMFGEFQPSELSLSDAELAVHRRSEAGEDIEEFDFGLLETNAP
jgi:HPt (histidine-containing phosphotransfer) domain-containing protein